MKPQEKDAWIPFRKPNPSAKVRLFCFPYAGGGASVYRQWGQQLPPEIDVCAVQLPGRESRLREEPISDMATMAELLSRALSPYMDMPFALFGYSMGAGIAHALTRTLAEVGREPFLLMAAARRAPHLPVEELIHGLPREEFKRKLQQLGGTPKEAFEHEELMDLLLPLLRADLQLNDTYCQPQTPSIGCAVSAYGGLLDQRVPQGGVESWRESTTGSFRLRMFEGGHFFIRDSASEVMSAVAEDLLR